MDKLADEATPESIAAAAIGHGCRSVAFTYNDPVIFAEYAMDIADACRAIISVALHEDDWRWAQSVCLEATNHTEFEVKRSAITGLCHIVRIHQTIDLPLITPALKRLQKDPNLRGYVDNFFSDATVFYKSSGQH
jgi:hypothetical protein